ncbi:MAG TPA: AmmeMemoRadiSam system protein B [Tepidisphaeraceae bacterium]|nr:AmmeMemoRadiSam system protein B [Tepidisphaeraceae bacterium]
MVAATTISIRGPAVAGRFYPGDPARCSAEARRLIATAPAPRLEQNQKLIGALVPHAGWICSGQIAAQALSTLAAANKNPDLVIVFAAVHTPIPLETAALDSHDVWTLPGQRQLVNTALRHRLAEDDAHFVIDDRFHARDHAVEVELPLISALYPGVPILPLEVPATEEAPQIGQRTAAACIAAGLHPVYLASSDLTHYGPNYRFAPAGTGPEALNWAMQNDRHLLDLVTAMNVAAIVPEAKERQNACGAGAIAAMMAACREHGASRAMLLRHSNSFETLSAVAPQPSDNAVGYAALVVG